MAQITIFHTSDMHNKLTSDYAGQLRDLKASVPDSLMFDSGDAIWSGNVYWRPGGEPVMCLMNSVPYDAMCIGNREFHFLSPGINSKTCKADFPILSANLRATKRRRRMPAEPFIFVERDGIRIAIMGLSVPCVTERMLVKKVSDYYFEQPIAAAAEIVPKLKAESDLLIALTHIGINKDRELAEKVPGIDIILGGHTHVITDEPEKVGDTYIIHHGFYVHYAGKVTVDTTSGGIKVTNELIPIAKA